MLRRWCMALALAALTVGTALTATSASAAPTGVEHFSPGGLAHLVGMSAAHGRGLSYQAESTNWSGYAGTTGTYTSVSASWTQPAGICSRGDQYAAFWVGLDGYTSSTVEQTGSEVDCVGRTAQYYAWYEMYPGPVGELLQHGQGRRPLHRHGDLPERRAASACTSPTPRKAGATPPTRAWARRRPWSSAEAIVEAPCCTC